MSGFRIPGALCSETLPWSIFDGTSALSRAPRPGPVCAEMRSFPLLPVELGTPAWLDLAFLFRECPNPKTGLSDSDYASAAQALGVDVATVKAVADVETSGSAFDATGRPRILYERHYFHRLTQGRYDREHAGISSGKAGGYGKFSAQYGKLEEAYRLEPDAALSSASWGRFQIMGSNYRAAGFASVRQFVKAMTQSESAHLAAFVAFVSHDRAMSKALTRRDWAGFARAYNGKGYKKNLYDGKLAAAYQRFAREEAAASTVESGKRLP